MLYVIYELIDPRTSKTRYIGITTNTRARYQRHLSCLDGNPAKNAWVQEILAASLKPIMNIVEHTDDRILAYERERYWIDTYREKGAELLNVRYGVIPPQPYTHKEPIAIPKPKETPHEDIFADLHEKYEGMPYLDQLKHPDYLNDFWCIAHQDDSTISIHSFVLGLFYDASLTQEHEQTINEWYKAKCEELRRKPILI